MKKILAAVCCAALAAGAVWYALARQQAAQNDNGHQVISQSSVLAKIRELNRLESTAFYIDTIIRTEKRGNWYALWQDSQKGVFVGKGNVVAGLDLNRLRAEQVHVLDDTVIINLPPVEILSVQLDHIEVYDWRTGAFNLLPADTAVLDTVQSEAKRQLLQQACKSGILAQARERSQTQIAQLFALAKVKVSVYPAAATGDCTAGAHVSEK